MFNLVQRIKSLFSRKPASSTGAWKARTLPSVKELIHPDFPRTADQLEAYLAKGGYVQITLLFASGKATINTDLGSYDCLADIQWYMWSEHETQARFRIIRVIANGFMKIDRVTLTNPTPETWRIQGLE